jgi:hypothetical protein
MAVGAVVLAIAMIDGFIEHIRGTARASGHEDELKMIE